MNSRARVFVVLVGLLMCLLAFTAKASEIGVSDQEIVLGQSLGITGPLAQIAPDIVNGGKAYFDAINSTGGIYGRKIRSVVLDDGYDPARTLKTARQLIEDDKAFALYNFTGTANVAAILPMLANEAQPVPLVGPLTGADGIRNPRMDNVFHVRASYEDELEKLVEHLTTVGIKRLGVLWINNGMGKDGMAGIEKAMKKHGVTSYASVSIQPDGSDAEKAIASLRETQPAAIIMITTGTATVSFIKGFNKVQKGMRFYALSVMGTQSALKALGPDGIGVVVTTVVPFPWSNRNALAKEYQSAMRKAGYDNLSFLGFEAYINAKVIAEAIRRAGKDLTRAKFNSSMESMRDLNLGGFHLSFNKNQHQGSRFVELAIIRDGERFTK
ncbi:MAG: ABC transporter substrate-binding protein [Burkholderiales bacterium]|nr:ABC transporter substrate-binding protein [Burkholderiales bacterium]